MKKSERDYQNPSETPMVMRAELALRRAVAKAISDHKRTGDPIVISRDGKVTVIPADQIEVREPPADYGTADKKRT